MIRTFFVSNILLFNGFQPFGAYAVGADDNMSTCAGPVYLESVYKVKCLVQNVRMQGLRSPEMRSLLIVNEQFSGKRNEEGGHYGQTLISLKTDFPVPEIVNKMIVDHASCLHKFFIPLTVNGIEIKFIFDAGASIDYNQNFLILE